MVSLMLWLCGGLASGIAGTGKQIAIEIAKFVALRALFLFFVFVAAPIIIYNVLGGLTLDLLGYAISKMAGIDVPQLSLIVSFSGIGGWIAQQIDLPGAFAIFMACVSVKFDMQLVKLMWWFR